MLLFSVAPVDIVFSNRFKTDLERLYILSVEVKNKSVQIDL